MPNEIPLDSIPISLIQPSALFLMIITFVVSRYHLRYVSHTTGKFWNPTLVKPSTVHSLESQSLGVVSANLRQQIMGRYVKDPRRGLQIVSMWLETPSFLFIMLGSTLEDLEMEQGLESLEVHYAYIVAGFMITALSLGVLGMLAAVALRYSKHPRAKDLQQKIIIPLVFDIGFTTIASSGIRLVTCDKGMDFYLNEPSSCMNLNANQVAYVLIGLTVFFCIYFGALYLKTHREANALLVRIRFHSEFLVLVIAIRTSIALYKSNRVVLMSFFPMPVVHIVIGAVYAMLMLLMLIYNYYYQPCLGSGKLANNIRALSFTTGFSSSVMILCAGIMQHNEKMDLVVIHSRVMYFLYGGVPVLLLAAWVINDRRARKFDIPDLTVAELLETTNDRYRQVACEALCLIPHKMMSPGMRSRTLRSLEKFITSETLCSVEVEALASKAYLHLKCLEQPDNPFGFVIEEGGDVAQATWIENGPLQEKDRKVALNFQRHAVFRNFRMGEDSTTTTHFATGYSKRGSTRGSVSLPPVSDRKSVSRGNKTAEAAVVECFQCLHSTSDTASAAACSAILDLYLEELVTINDNSLFALAFQFCQYGKESSHEIAAIETLYNCIVQDPVTGLDTNLPSSFTKNFALFNVTTQLVSECSETVQYAAETSLELLRIYSHWRSEVILILSSATALRALDNLVRAWKRSVAEASKSKRSGGCTAVNSLVTNVLSAAILLFASILTESNDLPSLIQNRRKATGKGQNKVLNPELLKLYSRKITKISSRTASSSSSSSSSKVGRLGTMRLSAIGYKEPILEEEEKVVIVPKSIEPRKKRKSMTERISRYNIGRKALLNDSVLYVVDEILRLSRGSRSLDSLRAQSFVKPNKPKKGKTMINPT